MENEQRAVFVTRAQNFQSRLAQSSVLHAQSPQYIYPLIMSLCYITGSPVLWGTGGRGDVSFIYFLICIRSDMRTIVKS